LDLESSKTARRVSRTGDEYVVSALTRCQHPQDCEDDGCPLPDVLSNFSAEIVASIERHSDLQGR
jgi:hypothetical protein